MSKRITPAQSAAKRAAFTQQKQKFKQPKRTIQKFTEVGFGIGAEETYLRHQAIFWKQWSKNYYG